METESDLIWQQEVIAQKPADKTRIWQIEEASIFLAAVKSVRK